MKKCNKIKLKINKDTMTTIVVYALLYSMLLINVGVILMCFGIDISPMVDYGTRLFGTELGVCGLIKVFDITTQKRIKKIEEGEVNG
jgi:hypothetical protein